MEKENELESGFRVQNILMMELTFNRIPKVTFNSPEKIKHDISVDVGIGVDDKKVSVTERVTVIQEYEGTKEYTVSVTMLGMFDVIGSPKLSLEEFGAVNGAAIIFPYVREIITATCSRAGLGLLFIPPFDFTKNRPKVQVTKVQE